MRIPATLVILGEPIEITTESGDTWEFAKNKFYLSCSMSGRELWIIPQPQKPKLAKTVPAKAARLFKRFAGWSTDWAARFEVSEFSRLAMGRAVSIAYRSSKWSGKPTGYIHTFDYKTKIEVDNKKLPGLWRLSGSKLLVKAVGITG
jgi:hypothetical protein